MFGGYGENLYFCTRFRERKVLHQSEREQRVIDRLIQSEKLFSKKVLKKFGAYLKKSLSLHPLSQRKQKTKATRKSEIFERFT